MSVDGVRLRGIRAVALDLDGTLVDTSHDFHVSINLLRAELSLAPLSLIAITR
jgi:phosphoglycolate phosphatase